MNICTKQVAMVQVIGSLSAIVFCLAGCTQGQESFSTEPGKGYGWKDMTETRTEIHKSMGLEASALPLPALPVSQHVFDESQKKGNLLSEVTRMPEHYMKVWFAPYQDSLGNLHEECSIHTVMKTGHWVVPTVVSDIA